MSVIGPVELRRLGGGPRSLSSLVDCNVVSTVTPVVVSVSWYCAIDLFIT